MKKIIEMILVNTLTIFRLVGVFCIYPVFKKYGGLDAAFLSAFCYFTDCLDGFFARQFHISSFLGAFLDASADKLFSAANLLVLLAITKLTLFPLLIELAILAIQAVKFTTNGNVQSSMMGKIKTWIIGLTVICLYFISDINKITILPNSIINMFNNANPVTVYFIALLPLYVFEILALCSYVKEMKSYTPEEKEKTTKISVKLRKEKCFKDKLHNFAAVWMNNEFYEKYKDSAGYKDILKEVKRRRKSW